MEFLHFANRQTAARNAAYPTKRNYASTITISNFQAFL